MKRSIFEQSFLFYFFTGKGRQKSRTEITEVMRTNKGHFKNAL